MTRDTQSERIRSKPRSAARKRPARPPTRRVQTAAPAASLATDPGVTVADVVSPVLPPSEPPAAPEVADVDTRRSARTPIEPGSLISGPGLDPLVMQTVAERYQVMERLDSGALGVVYRAEHLTLGVPVALKVMHPHLCSDERAVERFRAEAMTASRLAGEVVTVLDLGRTADGRLYVAMELLPGESLADLMAREGRLSQRRTVELIRQIARRLLVLHAQGVVHGDLRPRHVVLSPLPDGTHVVKLLGSSGPEPTGTRLAGMRAGRPAWSSGDPRYLAPEQREGRRADPRSDVFALMLMAHEMLAGSLPPAADRPRARPASDSSGPAAADLSLSRLQRALPGLHEGLALAFRRALSSAPALRLTTILALLEVLPMPSAVPPESPGGRRTTLPLGLRRLAAPATPSAATEPGSGRRAVTAERVVLEAATSAEIGLSAEWYASGELSPADSQASLRATAPEPVLREGHEPRDRRDEEGDDERVPRPRRWGVAVAALTAAAITLATGLGLATGVLRIALP